MRDPGPWPSSPWGVQEGPGPSCCLGRFTGLMDGSWKPKGDLSVPLKPPGQGDAPPAACALGQLCDPNRGVECLLIARCCCLQVPQMRLKPQKFCCLQFWRPDVGNGVSVGWLLPEALRESGPGLFQLLVAPGVPRLVHAALWSLRLRPVCFPYLQGHWSLGLGSTR